MYWVENPGVSQFGGFDLTELDVDEAWLNVTPTKGATNLSLWLYELSSNCHGCPYQLSSNSAITESATLGKKIKTTFPLTYRLRTSGKEPLVLPSLKDSKLFCEITHGFGEFGVYDLRVSKGIGKEGICEIVTQLEPVNIYIPILLAVLFYLAFAVVWCVVSRNKEKLLARFVGILDRFTERFRIATDSEPLVPSSSSETELIRENQTNIASSSDTSASTSRHSTSVIGKPKTKRKKSLHKDASHSQVPFRKLSESSSLSEEDRNVPPRATVERNTEETNSDSTRLLYTDSSTQYSDAEVKTIKDNRLRFLDTFRGICIVMMIFVNDGGAEYYFFEHATWDGLYFADLVFPWFLMGMGISIPLSITGQLRKGNSQWKIFRNISARSCKLILIGLVLNTVKGPNPTSLGLLRFPGVLQRFGICYFVAASLFLYLGSKKMISTMESSERRTRVNSICKDFEIIWIPWSIIILLMTFHSFLTFGLIVPGCPIGYLGPGGLHSGNIYPGHCVGGAAGYIDRLIFSVNHIYKWPTAKSVYKCGAYDPEGFLGLFNSIGQVWFGLQTGVTLLTFRKPSSRMIRWFILAVITGVLALGLSEAKQTGGMIPINKNLWSLSYTFATTSLALFLFIFLYVIIDVKLWWRGSPFFECGMNSIALYVGHTVAYAMLPWHFTYGRMATHFSRLVETLWGTSLWILIAIYFHRKGWFYSV